MEKIRKHPIIVLLIINLLIGIFTFQNYGLSWDEPLFYDYANALPYAYSPSEWFSGNFNLENAYGSSGTDHANRGPAYLLLARPFVSLVELLSLDNASAWHLINFLAFQLGIYLFYRLAIKWMGKTSALAASALFAWQPLLWGHAFINPKDMPFLVFFSGAICFGFEMVDEIAQNEKPKYTKAFIAAFFLGIATSIRVLGPLAAILTGLYALGQLNKIKPGKLIKHFAVYAFLTILITFIAWPYLWTNPLQKFIEVFGFMSANPTQLTVLFNGSQYQADELPRRYLPTFLGYTLTEPVWLLFITGLIIGFWKSNNQKRFALSLTLLWFIIPTAYVILRKPPMYDGFRHFLFILPPIFIFSGFALEKIFELLTLRSFARLRHVTLTLNNSEGEGSLQLSQRPFAPLRESYAARKLSELLKINWAKTIFIVFILAFGIIPSVQLHPYEYAYYNTFTGGVGGAFRQYETEYWLTCYREAVLKFNEEAQAGSQLFVRREPYIAAYYASADIIIRNFRTEQKDIQPGDYVLANTRSNEDLRFLRDQPPFLEISRNGAAFCMIKQVP